MQFRQKISGLKEVTGRVLNNIVGHICIGTPIENIKVALYLLFLQNPPIHVGHIRIPINLAGDGLPNTTKPVLRDPLKALTPIENIKVALDLLITFRTPSYL